MAFAAGTRFGVYEIAGLIGVGGMGEVYRATDTTLGREVAIKVLPESFAANADRIARFEREAKTLASLNHTNIGQIYGLERRDGTTALVMELVEGPTLAHRLMQGPIPADEALNIAMQIADALEAAHALGIVHRDLKPANIKLRPDGTVKVLDFGIAKALELQATSGSQALALTTPAVTELGVVLGTAAYMSPEQARGKAVDRRSDIWAFGCVLYEMLTGRAAFGAEDVTSTLARVLERDPNVDALPNSVAPVVRHAIKLFLSKDPNTRVADIRDAKLALDGVFESNASHGAVDEARSRSARSRLPYTAAVFVIGAAVSALAVLSLGTPELPEPRVTRFTVDVPDGEVLGIDPQSQTLAVSRDGAQLVFATTPAVNEYEWYARSVDSLMATQLSGAEGSFEAPFFSPDGRWIGFADNPTRSLKRIPSSGGPATMMVGIPSANGGLRGASWGIDDTILFGTDNSGLWRVAAGGGEPEQLTAPDVGTAHRWPQWLPGRRAALFTLFERNLDHIALLDLDAGETRVLFAGGSSPSYVGTGHIVYAAADGTLRAIGFDLATLTVTGDPFPIVENVALTVGRGAHYALADNGTLVYASGASSAEYLATSRLVWVNRDGSEEPINVEPRNYVYADLSPDGNLIALDIRAPDNDIWIWNIERATLSRLTFDPLPNFGLAWSSDSQRIAFVMVTNSTQMIHWQAAHGGGEPELIGPQGQPSHITSDGILVYSTPGQVRDVAMVTIGAAPSDGTPLLNSRANERAASVSPNGDFIAYQSDESGRIEVYIRPFPDVSGDRVQISTTGGTRPLWSADGDELFYYLPTGDGEPFPTSRRGAVMAVPISYEPDFSVGNPTRLFEGDYAAQNADLHTYDVTADSQRFLMVKEITRGEDSAPRQLVVVQNWFEELKQRVPTD